MSAFWIDFFASKELNKFFWIIVLMTLPAWLLMLVGPQWRVSKFLCRPWALPVLYALFYFFPFYLMIAKSSYPGFSGVDQEKARGMLGHPFLFMAFLTHLQVGSLFIACIIYQDGLKHYLSTRFCLLLTWFAAPLGIIVYALQRLIDRVR